MEPLKTVARKHLSYEHRQQIRHAVEKCRWVGFSRYCPCCDSHLRRFKSFGVVPRADALCPVCGSLERHRLVYVYVTEKTDLFDGRRKKMLHVAPEPQLSRLFQKADYIEYLSADLSSTLAMVNMDVTDIRYPDETFDVIYCSHVLEHVLDDTKAIREMHRVLKSGGWAILQVPISAKATFEDPMVTSPEERERLFGQDDHVRRYGPDYKDRLTDAGFSVAVDGFVRELSHRTITRFGLMPDEDIYFCRKEQSRRFRLPASRANQTL